MGNREFKVSLDKFQKKVLNLRLNWFETDMKINLDTMIDLLSEANHILGKGILLFQEHIHKYTLNNPAVGTGKDIIYLNDPNYPIMFKESKDYFRETVRLFNKYGSIVPVFPREFSALLSEYKKHDGLVAKHISKHLKGYPCMLKPEFKGDANLRISHYDGHIKYCIKHGLGYGPLLHFQIHDRPKKFRSKIIRYSRESAKIFQLNKIFRQELRI